MPPRLSWSNLLPGLIALTVLVSSVVGILLFAGVGKVKGDTVRLHVLTGKAHGVMAGTEVWLFGQKVGVVKDVSFRRPSLDTAGRVVLGIDVREDDMAAIRRDAPVSIRTGANVMGPMVVHIGAGSPATPGVREGDTLRAEASTGFQTASAKLTDATAQVPALMSDARTVMSQVRGRQKTIDGIMSGEVAALRTNVARVRAGMSGANVAEPMRAARLALARADSIRSLLGSGASSYGRFRRDSTLLNTIASVRDDVADLRARLASSDGNLERWRTDSAIVRSLADVQREMTLLFDDVKKRPMRYFQF